MQRAVSFQLRKLAKRLFLHWIRADMLIFARSGKVSTEAAQRHVSAGRLACFSATNPSLVLLNLRSWSLCAGDYTLFVL